jgi:CBS-domain-containing membrane protein
MALRARDVMTSRVVTVRPQDAISAAIHKMTELGFSALPVVDEAYRLVGIISLLDVLRHRVESGDDTDTVGAVMNRDVLSLPPRASLGLLAHRLRTYGELRVMPIVERGMLVGVVTRSDVLRGWSRPGLLGRLAGRLRGDEPVETLRRARRAGNRSDAAHVRDVVSTPVVVARVSEPVEEIGARLVEHRLKSLPVVDEQQRLIGLVSEADLLGREPLSGRRGQTASAVMTREVVTLAPDDTLTHARLLFAERGLRVVPVVENGRLVGVVSRSDLL